MRVFNFDVRRPLWFVHRRLSGSRPIPPPISVDNSFFIAEASGIDLPPESSLRRDWPGPTGGLPTGFETTMDMKGLFYDVFWDAGQVVLTGPPLSNFAPLVRRAQIALDGKAAHGRLRTARKSLMQLSSIPSEHRPRELSLDLGSSRVTVPVQQSRHDVFQGRKVLFGISKDNELDWIVDWIDFHVRAHAVDAVLLYDNASTLYGPTDLLDRIAGIPGLAAAVVVPWPYKFGCHGPRFDGYYCQYAAIETARRRFLKDAAGMLQIDVDEIVVSDTGESLFDELDRSPRGALLFQGVWIENLEKADTGPRRHRDFRYRGDDHHPTKWAVIPARLPDGVQMKNHDFENGFNAPLSSNQHYRHFKAISTSWKYKRDEVTAFDPDLHRLDEAWAREMARIGWSSAGSSPFSRRDV